MHPRAPHDMLVQPETQPARSYAPGRPPVGRDLVRNDTTEAA